MNAQERRENPTGFAPYKNRPERRQPGRCDHSRTRVAFRPTQLALQPGPANSKAATSRSTPRRPAKERKDTDGTPEPLQRRRPRKTCVFLRNEPKCDFAKKQAISGCCERGWKHYRKMTNGFVFRKIGIGTAPYDAATGGGKGGPIPLSFLLCGFILTLRLVALGELLMP